MNATKGLVDLGKIGLAMSALLALTGCVGWVDSGGGYGGAVVAPVPEVYIFGGGYERERDVHAYRARGEASRERVYGRDRR